MSYAFIIAWRVGDACWRIQGLTYDLVPLVYVVCSREHDPSPDHLSHDAAHWPDVDVLPVAHAQDDFWGPVVPGHDVGGHHERRSRRPGQTEVQDFERAVRPDHDVAGLEVLKTKIKVIIMIERN